MLFLPLVERELRLASRRHGTYRTRFWAALILIALSFCMHVTNRQSDSQLSRPMFTTLTILVFAYCLLAGVAFTADCLSEEKREGTLGFLFLTDLRGYDVVFSKLLVTSLQAFYGLLAALPVLGLPLLLGGITGVEFWRVSVLLVSTLLFSLALGLLISALGREERSVTLGTLLAALWFAFGLPALWKLATALHDSRWFDRLFLFPCPSYAYQMAGSGIFTPRSSDFWPAVATLWTLTLLCLIASSVLLPRVFQEKTNFPWAARGRERFRRWRFQIGARGRAWRERLFGTNPYLWFVSRDRLPELWLWLFVLLVSAFAAWLYPVVANKQIAFKFIVTFGPLGLHLLLKVLIAAEACRNINDDRRSGGLEVLLSTGLSLDSILKAQMAALKARFALPMGSLMALNFVLILAVNEHEPGWVIFGGAIILVFDFFALSWVGMRLALRGLRYHRTVLMTVAFVMFPAWAVLAGFIFVSVNGAAASSSVNAFFFWWFILSAGYGLSLVGWAKATARRDLPINGPGVRWAWAAAAARESLNRLRIS